MKKRTPKSKPISGKAKKTSPPVTTKATKDDTLREEGLTLLQKTQFGGDGFRLIPSGTLSRYEYDFKGFSANEKQAVLRYEYFREIEGTYTQAKYFKGLQDNVPSYLVDVLSPHIPIDGLPTFMEYISFFPLPTTKIKEILKERFTTSLVSRAPALREEKTWDGQTPTPNPDASLHAFSIYWHHHISDIKDAFADWLKKEDQQRKKRGLLHANRRGHPDQTHSAEMINQLVAWRAKRAGMDHSDYMFLGTGLYNDSSSFRKAIKAASDRIHAINKRLFPL
jgi:hypothetical protein